MTFNIEVSGAKYKKDHEDCMCGIPGCSNEIKFYVEPLLFDSIDDIFLDYMFCYCSEHLAIAILGGYIDKPYKIYPLI